MENQLESRSLQQENQVSSSRFYEEVDKRSTDRVDHSLNIGHVESAADKLDRTLIVRAGEGLWSVARKALDQQGADTTDARAITAKVREIIELNRDRFPSLVMAPHRVYSGQWLLVNPPKQVSESSIDEPTRSAKISHDGGNRGEIDLGDTHVRKAKVGQRMHAESGDEVEAEKGSKVIAHAGSEVQAMNGAFVLALPGSRVKAFHGSTVANYGGEVEEFKGAIVFDMQNMAASGNYLK
ncbi:hypothetical protein KBI23_05595 [bacterium]|nr:hypothetical protein [bacterium]MBP9810601.1 hypothetical protein [bacterium]